MKALRNRRAYQALQRGDLVANSTSTVAGVAANPYEKRAIQKLQRFKQRQGPFILLAQNMRVVRTLVRVFSPELRRAMHRYWPGAVTLVFAAKPPKQTGLALECYQRGCLAVRLEAFPLSEFLAKSCGGLLLSSSLNRRKEATFPIALKSCMRHQRWLSARTVNTTKTKKLASKIYRIRRNQTLVLRA